MCKMERLKLWFVWLSICGLTLFAQIPVCECSDGSSGSWLGDVVFEDVNYIVPAGEEHPKDKKKLRHNMVLTRDPVTFDVLENQGVWNHVLAAMREKGRVVKILQANPKQLNDIRNKFGAKVDIVFLRKGTPVEYAYDFFEAYEANDPIDVEELLRWFVMQTRAEIGWVNFSPDTLNILWVNEEGGLVANGQVHFGEPKTEWRYSYIGHKFVIESKTLKEGDEGYVRKEYIVLGDSINVIGTQESQKGGRQDMSQQEFDNIANYENKRADRIQRVFTDVGFKKIPVPRKLMGSILTFWYNNRFNQFSEIWKGKSVYVNWWTEVPTMAVPPFGLKQKWHGLFQPVLEEWSNSVLQPTDLYGVRTYYDGNWLVNHVDRHETHAVSAIINVEQSGIRSDWELEIKDVYGNVHHTDLQPGEAMLYESAKVMHGRPLPLEGDNYTNCFFHYQPKGEKEWWLNNLENNPPGLRPESIQQQKEL